MGMRIHKIRDVSLEDDIRDASFLDENHLALITPSADVWRASLIPGAGPCELLFQGRHILKRVSESLETRKKVEAAQGAYPRLAISHQSEWIVVNTHDLVLVACRNAQEFKTGVRSLRRADFETRLLTHTWGLHYSALQFSPDGSWLAVEHDGSSILFNMHDLAWRERAIRPPFAWHPQKPNLLGFDKQGRILWMDITQESPLPEVLCALEYDSVTANIAGLWMHPSGESCVTVYRHGHWVWWQLKPFQLLSQGMIDDSECGRVCGTPGV